MAITFLKVKVINPERPKKAKECEFLVDSGAVYSVVPHRVLKTLGIKPTSSQEFILANGEIVKRPLGNAYFEYQGKIRPKFRFRNCHCEGTEAISPSYLRLPRSIRPRNDLMEKGFRFLNRDLGKSSTRYIW